MGSECQIACADRETAATYVAFGFRETAPVASAGGRVLLAHDFRRAGTGLRGNRFHELFCELDVAEVVLPARTPPTRTRRRRRRAPLPPRSGSVT